MIIPALPSECVPAVLGALAVWIPSQKKIEIRFSVLIEMFVASTRFRGTFKSFWDLTDSEVSEQSWYIVLTYELVNPTFKISLLVRIWVPAVNAQE